MSILDAATPVADDMPAIAELTRAFGVQRAAFAANRNPTLAERQERLQALIGMMVTNRARISAAVASDFGAHPVPASDLIEVLGVIGRAQYVLEHIDQWMRPSPREMDAGLFGSASAYVQCQPKGVIGNIVPWNFPFDLSVGPMTEMLAAGNRVILKPSEYTPACAELLSEMIAATFDPSLVTVAVGGVDLARAFSSVPWDHLLYTGSPGVGRQVMAAAAANLTPVTLELGGKCPALLTPGSVTAASVEAVIGTKIIKNGQMCVSVDYALVPRADLDAFVDLAAAFMAKAAPDYARGDECTGMISERHLDRMADMLAEARDRQSRIVTLEADDTPDRATRCMPMSLVLDPPSDLRIMREEIFGPILPVVPYDNLDDAIQSINAGDRPLGLYVFGDDPVVTDHVLAATTSGGAAINTCAVQSALPSMGFGGSGMSGMGRHHGIEGFREFSNQRGVVVRGQGDMIDAFYAPYAKAAAIVASVLTPT
ncbi:coniferyl-aldehyde dehydrogenase [Sphingomonas sp. UYAg733]